MPHRLSATLVAVVLLGSTGALRAQPNDQPLQLVLVASLAELAGAPQAYIGLSVRVHGTVSHVHDPARLTLRDSAADAEETGAEVLVVLSSPDAATMDIRSGMALTVTGRLRSAESADGSADAGADASGALAMVLEAELAHTAAGELVVADHTGTSRLYVMPARAQEPADAITSIDVLTTANPDAIEVLAGWPVRLDRVRVLTIVDERTFTVGTIAQPLTVRTVVPPMPPVFSGQEVRIEGVVAPSGAPLATPLFVEAHRFVIVR